jgi:hypothetical protein
LGRLQGIVRGFAVILFGHRAAASGSAAAQIVNAWPPPRHLAGLLYDGRNGGFVIDFDDAWNFVFCSFFILFAASRWTTHWAVVSGEGRNTSQPYSFKPMGNEGTT